MSSDGRSHGPIWHSPRRSAFELRRWDDGCVVYDDRGAFLHLLTPIAGEAFAVLMKPGSHDNVQVARALLHDSPDADELAMVDELLQTFKDMGFIERLHE